MTRARRLKYIRTVKDLAEKVGANRVAPSFYPRLHNLQAAWMLRILIVREKAGALTKRLTARERGECDALLDAFGL